MNRPPFQEDFFQRIVNVNWSGGAVFVTGDDPGVCYFKVASRTSAPILKSAGWLDFTNKGIVSASSYANVGVNPMQLTGIFGPTFLVGGAGDNVGLIYVSNDGLNWQNVFNRADSSVNMLVWDKKAKSFFADISDATVGDAPVCYASVDGHSWAPGGGTFLSHCEFGLPDGQFGYDEKHDLFKSATQLGASAVTFAGGVWAKVVVEGVPIGEIAINRVLWVSFDGTKTWIAAGAIPEADAGIITICGAPLTDLRGR